MEKSPLEKLIKSLTRGELKTFSLSVKNEKSPEYYNLFKKIKQSYDKKKSVVFKNAQRKKYLYDSILESLNKKTKSIDANILKKLLNTETLYKRQLIKEAWKEINKAQKLAKKHERFGLLIQILEWKKNIGFHIDTFTRNDYSELSIIEEQTINQQFMFLKMKNLYMEILSLKKEQGYFPKNYDKSKFTKFSPEIPKEVISKRTIFYSRITKAIYFWMQKKHEEEYQLTKLNIKEADVNVDYTEYLIGHLEHLTSCICNASFSELISTLNELKTKYSEGYFGENYNLKLKLFYYAATYEIMSYAFMGNEFLLRKKVEEVENEILFWKKNLSKEMYIIICTALKTGYFFLGDYKKSKFYINKILVKSNKTLRKDAFDEALLFNLIIVFDKKNDYNYQKSVLNSSLKYFKNSDMSDSLENLFAKALQKDIFDKNIYRKVYNNLENEFIAYFHKLKDGRLYSESYLPLYIWLQSKIKNKDLLTVMKNWNENSL